MINTCNTTNSFLCVQDYMKHNIVPLTAGISTHMSSTILFKLNSKLINLYYQNNIL